MSLRFVPVDEIGEAHLQGLIEDGVAEGRDVDYKLALPGTTPDDKKEFLADVSSFANAGGGDIVFGVDESAGLPTGVPGLADDLDDAMLRLEGSIRDGISPRIQGVRSHPVPLSNGKGALVVRVPRSFARPHVVAFRNHWKFFTRSSNGKHQMDVDEVRAAFLGSEAIAERVRAFRAERLGRIVSGEAPAALEGGAKAVLHVAPLSAFDLPAPAVDLDSPALVELLHPISSPGAPRHNFDGVISEAAEGRGGVRGYAQLFRWGVVEAADAYVVEAQNAHAHIPGAYFEESLIDTVEKHLGLLRRLGVGSPVLVMLSLVGVRGYRMRAHGPGGLYGARPIDREDLVVPEAMAEEGPGIGRAGVELLLKPMIDSVWNACGYARSPNFGDNGRWTNPTSRSGWW